MNNKIFDRIYKLHIKQLKNLDIPHKKLAIFFSGIAGSGKTYIAKILENKYQGVRIRSDDVRGIIIKLDQKADIDEIAYGYLDWFFDNYNFNNKLIILDRGIDRKYSEVIPFFKERGYKIFIIRLNVPEKVYERRIIKKLGKLDDNYINRINDWKKQYKEFGKNVKSDIIIKNDKDNKLNLNPLYSKLEKLI